MTKKKEDKPKLNDPLYPEKFEICVPARSQLLGINWWNKGTWRSYVEDLANDNQLEVPDYLGRTQEPEPNRDEISCCGDDRPSDSDCDRFCCCTCDCKPGWVLRGELAVAHACRVHDRIHRQALSLEQVSAVDVGFAIWERQTKFENFLAIRIHVNRKLPPEQLVRAGLSSFSEPSFASSELADPPGFRYSKDGENYRAGQPDDCPDCRRSARWQNLQRILKGQRKKKKLLKFLTRYPIGGVRKEDLSVFCSRDIAETCTADDVRLCICGVPIDIVNAEYNASGFHPGGDAESGVFVEPPQQSNELKNEEHLLIGRGRVNPLVGGISVGSVTGQAGTLATIVWDRTDGTPCVLSNWHVLAGNPTARVDQPTYQPALFDGGTEDDEVAHLKRWYLGEEGDAAIAELSGSRYYASGEILGMWHPISGCLPPELNLEIRKWGRTTGFTQGFIDGIHLATNIDYGNGVVRYFRNQFHIAPLHAGEDVSQVGDSGSLVLTRFRPVELRDDLARFCEWLRECCYAHSGTTLCCDIATKKKELLDKHRDECPQIYVFLKGALEKLTAYCTDEDMRGLCHAIEELLQKLREICECATFCASAEGFFRDLLPMSKKKMCKRVDKAEDILTLPCKREDEDNEGFGSSLEHETCRKTCNAFEKAIEELKIACGNDANRDRLRRIIQEARENLCISCTEITRCLPICADVIEIFEGWLEWCKKIESSRVECERICEILATDCKDLTCKKSHKLVKCIEKGLKENLAPIRCPDKESVSSKLPDDDFKKKFERALQEELKERGFDSTKEEQDWFRQLLKHNLTQPEFLESLIEQAKENYHQERDAEARNTTRAYYAVGMIFAGDTPGSPFGEFAVASDIERLAKELRFSLQPVFEPRSSFRELRTRPPGQGRSFRASRSRRGLTPGSQGAAPRGGGPQPDPERAQGDPDE